MKDDYSIETKNPTHNSKELKQLLSSQDNDFYQIIFLASKLCNVPMACMSLIGEDYMHCKYSTGINFDKEELRNSFSHRTLESNNQVTVLNYSEDPVLFKQVGISYDRDIKFYAGVSLKNNLGMKIGVLSILDSEERSLDGSDLKAFHALANQCNKLIEFSFQNQKFQEIQNSLKEKYQELEKFASLVSHDIKSPLANIISLTELLREENKGKLDAENVEYLNYLVESSYSLRNYVDGILVFYKSEQMLDKDYENVNLEEIVKTIVQLFNISTDVSMEYPKNITLHKVNKSALTQVLLNLVSNSLKYNNKKERNVKIQFEDTPYYYRFKVIDNGNGIQEGDINKIFQLFTTLDTNDRDGNPGSGIGLATVQKLVTNMGGKIKVSSEIGKGSTFDFSVKRL